MKNLLHLRPLLLGVTLLSTVASATLLIESHHTRNTLATLAAQRAALESQLHQKRLQPGFPSSPAPQNHPSAPASSVPAPASTAPAQDPLADEPALQTLQLIARRAAFPTRYAPFLRSQPLSTTQLTALEDLLSRREEQRLDLTAVIRSHQLPASDPAIARLSAQADRELRQALVQLIGAQPTENLVEFERKLPAWELVSNFAGTVALEGQPLTPDQATELAEVIATASPSYQAGNDVAPADVNWPAVITQTVAVLTPPQATSFRNMAPTYPMGNPATSGRR